MRISLLSFFLFASVLTVIAQPKASIGYATFNSEEGPYVEVYVSVERASLEKTATDRQSATFTLVFSQDDEIQRADKVELIAPVDGEDRNFVEALRYRMPNGNYRLNVEGVDKADTSQLSLKLATDILVDYASDSIGLSDLQLSAMSYQADSLRQNSSLVKGGFVLEPLPQNFVKRQMEGFTAYIEAYYPTSLQNQPALLEYTVIGFDDNGTPKDIFRKTKRFSATDFSTPFFININTESLASGSYGLKMTLRDQSLQSIAEKVSIFILSNPEQDVEKVEPKAETYDESFVFDVSVDSLKYVLRSILPIVSASESDYLEGVINSGNLEAQRLAIYNHFLGESEKYPHVAYRAYMDIVREIDAAFKNGFRSGFESDRGYIYLKYGQPDDRVIVNEDPSAPPYEIWIYNYVERTFQGPGKFLFYNPTLDNASYTLLHSTVRGEIAEPQWKRILYSRSTGQFQDGDTVQGTDIGDHVGRYADEYFSDF
ncbi:MAG: GWxTD domain-containing protein [Saprospiraceae bacterium]